jgi:hypothetical protein
MNISTWGKLAIRGIVLGILSITPLQSVAAESKKATEKATQHLLAAYPKQLCGVQDNILQWCDGTKMPLDDGITDKDFLQILEQPDLEDQFRYSYPPGRHYQLPPHKNHDPGRVRYEPFFLKMYGESKQAVEQNLVKMVWPFAPAKPSFSITRVNGINQKMASVIKELKTLPDEMAPYLKYFSGSFNWRTIKGTKRYSMHSFGISIDIGGPWANYWRWDDPTEADELSYRNQIPLDIVLIFEKYGFIWGGKWYHYDTMHFEYRPELLN